MYIFRGRSVFIDVYKADHKSVTTGLTSLADINLQRTYRAIDSIATGRIPSLFCFSAFCLVGPEASRPETYKNFNLAAIF